MAEEPGATLEKELLARAERLAAEYLKDARATAEQIVRESEERVRLREQREVQLAETAGDRVYRQRVQAAALGFDAELERLRWALIQEVIGMLGERLTRFAEDEAAYLPLLRNCLVSAAHSIGRLRDANVETERVPRDSQGPDLVAEMNARDLKRFESSFGEIAHAAAPEVRIELSREPIDCLGGVVVRDANETMRVDATFDGRIQRLELRLAEAIMDRLFGALGEKGALLG